MTDENRQIIKLKGRQDELHAIKRVLLSPDGRVFCNYLVKTFCISTTLDENPTRHAFKEGQRALALQVIGTAYKPDQFASQINQLLEEIEQQQQE
jgi:hypothetical protein